MTEISPAYVPAPTPHLPTLVLPEAATHGLAQVLHLVAVLRTGNFQFGATQLAPYAQPMTAEALRVAFDRVIDHDAVGDESSYYLASVWKAGTIGERYLRLCQLAAFAVAAAEEIGAEIEAAEVDRWNQMKAELQTEEAGAIADANAALEARRPQPFDDHPENWG